jgi:hypothetical protein
MVIHVKSVQSALISQQLQIFSTTKIRRNEELVWTVIITTEFAFRDLLVGAGRISVAIVSVDGAGNLNFGAEKRAKLAVTSLMIWRESRIMVNASMVGTIVLGSVSIARR